jgi:uncharacterized protein YjbJ (UPF0337 family)
MRRYHVALECDVRLRKRRYPRTLHPPLRDEHRLSRLRWGTRIGFAGYPKGIQWEIDIMDKDRIAGTAQDWAGKAEGAVGDLAGDKDTQAAGRVREAAGKVQNLYGQAKDVARDAADTATDFAKKAVSNAGEGQEALAKMVQDNPLGSLLTAGVIGFGLALLLRTPAPPRRKRWYYD